MCLISFCRVTCDANVPCLDATAERVGRSTFDLGKPLAAVP